MKKVVVELTEHEARLCIDAVLTMPDEMVRKHGHDTWTTHVVKKMRQALKGVEEIEGKANNCQGN